MTREGPIFVKYPLNFFAIVCLFVCFAFVPMLLFFWTFISYITSTKYMFYCTPVTFIIIIIVIKTAIIVFSVIASLVFCLSIL